MNIKIKGKYKTKIKGKYKTKKLLKISKNETNYIKTNKVKTKKKISRSKKNKKTHIMKGMLLVAL